jgi:hypothetical protein
VTGIRNGIKSSATGSEKVNVIVLVCGLTVDPLAGIEDTI